MPGLAVVLATFVGQRFGTIAGGMLLAFPFVIGSGLVFAMAEGQEKFTLTAWSALLGLIPLGCSLACVALVSKAAPLPAALVSGAAVWALVALPVLLAVKQ